MANMTRFSNGRIGMPSLLGWDPMRLFDDLLSWNPRGGEVLWTVSPVHVTHGEDGVSLSVDMPGVDASDLELTFERGQLVIAGKRGARSYRYTVALGDEYDPDSIEANLDKGVLSLTAAKRPEAKPRKIALKGIGSNTAQKTLESGESNK